MAANSTFPGVYVSIIDNSFYTEGVNGVIGFMCMFAKRGPDNKPMLVTSASDLINQFGTPHPGKYGQGWYIAKQYVDILNNLWVMRVLPSDAKYATLALKLGTEDSTEEVNTEYVYDEYGNKVLDDDGNYETIEVARKEVNIVTIPSVRTWAEMDTVLANVDLLNPDDNTYSPTSSRRYLTTDDISPDSDAKDMLDETLGSVSGSSSGEVSPDSLIQPLADTDGDGDTTADKDTEPGIEENDSADVIFFPIGRGIWYNRYAIKLTPISRQYTDTYTLDVYELNDDYVTDEDEETTIPSLVESFTISFNKDAQDYAGNTLFVEEVLDRYSSRIRCKVSENIGSSGVAHNYAFSNDFSTYYWLTGGSDGTMYSSNGNLNWSYVQDDMVNAYVGLNVNPETGNTNDSITDTEDMDFSVVFDAGYPDPVKDSIVDLCDERGSCFAFLDNGDNTSASSAILARQTDHNYTTYAAALYEPYTKVYDSFTGKYVWMTPIYHVVNAFCKTARDKNLWWPFAGLQRGGCTGITEFRYKLNGGYKDYFKDYEINPIMSFVNNGDIIFGNWTTQSVPSALKNIHVVLTLHYIYRTLQKNLKTYIYELNDNTTWNLIKDNVTQFLSEIMSERGLEYFSVDVTATDYEKRNNKCHVDINLRVTGTIEIINCNLIVE